MVRLEQNRNHSGSLDDPPRRLMVVEIDHAVSETTLGWMPLLQVGLPLLVQRFRPWQHGNLNAARAEILEISGVRPPDSGQIGLPIRCPWRRSRQVGFSVGC